MRWQSEGVNNGSGGKAVAMFHAYDPSTLTLNECRLTLTTQVGGIEVSTDGLPRSDASLATISYEHKGNGHASNTEAEYRPFHGRHLCLSPQ